MRCCGVTDYTDWYPVLGENTVPDRCCMENSQGCGRNSTTPLWRTVRPEALPGSSSQEPVPWQEEPTGEGGGPGGTKDLA